MTGKSHRNTYPPITVIVERIGALPHERILPRETQMTINHRFSREKAQEMIEFLQKSLADNHLTTINVTITGPKP